MNSFSIRTLSILVASAAAVLSLGVATDASAADTPYCTGSVIPADSNANTQTTQTAQTHCFATFGDSVSYATGGRVKLANAETSRQVSPDELQSANSAAGSVSPALTVITSIDYQNASFSGASYIWTGSSACGAFVAPSMPSGWNDVVSSVATYSGCGVTLYQNGSYGGTHFNVGVNSSVANLGSFNDVTSSEKWCTSPTC